MDRLEMFRQNIHLLIGLLTCLVFGAVLILVIVTILRALLFRRRQRRAARAFRAARYEADGRPKPPESLGVCTQCGRVAPDVRHLPDGRRLCGRCDQSVGSRDESEIE